MIRGIFVIGRTLIIRYSQREGGVKRHCQLCGTLRGVCGLFLINIDIKQSPLFNLKMIVKM
jgi:hypothetical protein